ncbi:MAG: cellulose biosynthesis cyclic di-GMP-binding regulatory protein BcsB [Beijerinckiaceae bacterium]|nr:cellulose biosynthesis cyclic di-GMP-binding regulatory protein BcsB [Beijerinckiaceae bacterium]
MFHPVYALALITASALMIGGHASAQSFTSNRPVTQNTGAVAQGGAASRLPSAAPGVQSGAGAATRTAVSLARPPANASAPYTLRHLTNNINGFRLAGEIAQTEWPMFLTEEQAQQRLSFRLGYLAAVSVMPEGSYLSLSVNDTVVGRTNIVGTRGVRTAVFNIPPGLMKAGFNAVRITAEQRHRVDCSLEATYELWTQIDPTQTGLVLPRTDPGVTSIADLPAIPIDNQGALPIRAITPDRAGMASVERTIEAAQMISLVGRFAQPVVDFGPMARGEYGINLAVGPIDELRGQLEGLSIPFVHSPMVVVVPAAEGRRTTVIVTGRTEEEATEALQQLRIAASSKGTPEGQRSAAAFPGYRLGGGQKVRLRDLGVASQEFSGRLFRAAFNLILPPDFYSADYGKAIIDLAGGYAPGLGVNSQVIVSVNGRHVMSTKLTKAAGDVFKQNPMHLPLGSMRPGLNRIEIEAHLPIDADRSCDTLAAIAGPKRFLLLDATEIELPQIARIARMPDLAVTATGAFPYFGSQNRPTLSVPTPTRESVSAAATIATHLAIAAGRPINFRLRGVAPAPGDGPALIVAPAPALDAELLGSVGLKNDEIYTAWREKIDNPSPPASAEMSRSEQMARHRLVLQKNFPASCHLPTPEGGFRRAERLAGILAAQAVGQTKPVVASPVDLYAQWDSELRSSPGFFGRTLSYVEGAGSWALSKVAGARDAVTGQLAIAPAGPVLSRGTPLVMAQSILGSNAEDVRTIVTAPDSVTLQQSVACLVDPRVWGQISGRIAMLDTADGRILPVPVEGATLIATQTFSVQNVRLIVAGWFSLNNKIYVILALLLAALLALTTRGYVSHVGRRNT